MTSVRPATMEDLKYIEHLANREGYAVGFVPRPAYEAAISGMKLGKRWSPTCNDRLYVAEEDRELIGFALASFGTVARITQVAVQEDARRIDRGRLLVDAAHAEGVARGIDGIRAGCADDLESNYFWSALGFDKLGTRMGVHFESKKRSSRVVNIYQRQHSQLVLPFDEPVGLVEGTKHD